MYKIDKQKPVPKPYKREDELYETLDKMEVGDSFEAPKAKRSAIASKLSRYGQIHRKKFTCRSIGDTCRFWRVE